MKTSAQNASTPGHEDRHRFGALPEPKSFEGPIAADETSNEVVVQKPGKNAGCG